MGVLYAGMGVFVSGDFYCPGCVCLLGVVLYIYFALKGEVLSLECPRESTQREGRSGALIGFADSLRSSPLRGRAQLAISLCSIRSDRVRTLIPDWLRYSVSANG